VGKYRGPASKAHIPLIPELLLEVVEGSDKKRFAISADGQFII